MKRNVERNSIADQTMTGKPSLRFRDCALRYARHKRLQSWLRIAVNARQRIRIDEIFFEQCSDSDWKRSRFSPAQLFRTRRDFEIEENCAPRLLTAILKSRGRGGGSTNEQGQAAESASRSSLDPLSSFSLRNSLRRPRNSGICVAAFASRRSIRGSAPPNREKP